MKKLTVVIVRSTTDLRFSQPGGRHRREKLRVDRRLFQHRLEVTDRNTWKNVCRISNRPQQLVSVGRGSQHAANLRTVLTHLQRNKCPELFGNSPHRRHTHSRLCNCIHLCTHPDLIADETLSL